MSINRYLSDKINLDKRQLKIRQWLFCHQLHFTLEDYFAIRHLWLVNFNDILNMSLLVALFFNFNNQFKKFTVPVCILPHCTFSHSHHYLVYSHTGLPYSVHCLSLSVLPAKIPTCNDCISRQLHYPHNTMSLVELYQLWLLIILTNGYNQIASKSKKPSMAK